ncbi:hypothetical protein SAMN06265360_107193 [Haloechinothrix alba]|uniref:PhiRv1 phage protein n=1 Tax=Haloechinothrix alba TaxID=664784 RepID=A0A238WTJ5_9PSEU|nr:hypothetical protein [Haloechinothrix alba]SNR49723.1 hypothetical protein SAMN06265360_107193 [Haloechinothrix alba]
MARPSTTSARQRHNILVRHHGADAPETLAARRELEAAKLAEHIDQVVNTAPKLSPEQVERLRGLLPAPDNKGGSAA